MNEVKRVFIILLNWNNWNETRECLESLEKVDYKNFEVVIVDNNSSEEEKRKIRDFNTECYISNTIYNSSNLGFAGGSFSGGGSSGWSLSKNMPLPFSLVKIASTAASGIMICIGLPLKRALNSISSFPKLRP